MSSEAYAGVMTRSQRADDKAAMLSMLQLNLMKYLISEISKTLRNFAIFVEEEKQMVENGEDQNTAPHFAQNRRACVQRGGPT